MVHWRRVSVRRAKRSACRNTNWRVGWGVHRTTIAHWERAGGCVPSVGNLRVLSEELQVEFEWLAVGGIAGKALPLSAVPSSRRDLESRLLQLSRHVLVSFLAAVIALLENASAYLE
ncbi:helix-turn-helix transcriptional regulator [Xanthomonas translucens pv. undulosa]